MHNQLYDHFEQCRALSNAQSGFRKAHSTTTCLIEFLDAVYDNMENGRLSGVAFLDLKKAFDTVDYKLLLCKLSEMNISYPTIQWIDSYLSQRSQVTKVSHHTSLPGDLSCGVPQGSILGPLFFIVYINPKCN